MRLQSVLFNNINSTADGSFVHTEGDVQCERDRVVMKADSYLSTDTYKNIFSAGYRQEITTEKKYRLVFDYKGEADLFIYVTENNKIRQICKKKLKSQDKATYSVALEELSPEAGFFFAVKAKSSLLMENVFYMAEEYDKTAENIEKNRSPEGGVQDDLSADRRDIRLGLIICTFDGRAELLRNIREIKRSAFFNKEAPDDLRDLFGKLDIYIVDNKSRLPLTDDPHFKLFRNKNTGGTGGFTRGIEEIRKRQKDTGVTHVIFMDDDVVLDKECLYRLYSLLSDIRQEYADRPVAGCMLDASSPDMMYTAVEQWDKGYVKHIGHKTDVRDKDAFSNILSLSGAGSVKRKKTSFDPAQVYGGWWFCCYPYSFVKNNKPLPFFLHCDDVEYGIRNGRAPIILNGIDVCHDTPENKASAVLAYYDARNTMIVNSVYRLASPGEMISQWKNRLASFRDKNDSESIAMTLLAMIHFLRGPGWFLSVDGEILHKRLVKKDLPEIRLFLKMSSISYKLIWRSVASLAGLRIKNTAKAYERLRKDL